MKSIRFRIFIFLLVTCLFALSLASCHRGTDPSDDGPGEEGESGLCLLKDGVWQYRFVYAPSTTSTVSVKVRAIIRSLNARGLNCPSGMLESDGTEECEIIVGTESGREGCFVDAHTLGEEGWQISVVGKRIVIAGGSPEATVKALETFADLIPEGTETFTLPRGYTASCVPTYPLSDVTIGGTSVKDFALLADRADSQPYESAVAFRTALYRKTGIWLSIQPTDTAVKNAVIFRTVEDAGETGFRITCEGGSLIFEGAYRNVFTALCKKNIDAIFDTEGTAVIADGYRKTERANVLRYSDYGAVGDGKTDDFASICATHEMANLGGQKVEADTDAVYYIGQTAKNCVVQTDVDFKNAVFMIDDKAVDTSHKGYYIFEIKSDHTAKNLPAEEIEGLTLKKDQQNVGLTFDTDVMLRVTAKEKRIYIRFGENENGGSVQTEMIHVSANGDVDPMTPIVWDYDSVGAVTVYRIDDKPITVQGGHFITDANDINAQYYFNRGFLVSRANVTLKNISHSVTGEGEFGSPYSGFFSPTYAYNLTFDGVVFHGHKAYANPANPAAMMGSYDVAARYSLNVVWINCSQEDDITNQQKWGVHASDFCKNITVDHCSFSRFDAHQGIYNLSISNTVLGSTLNIIGGGTLRCTNVTRLRGEAFILLRADYGSTWEGDIILTDCVLEGFDTGYRDSRYGVCSVFSGMCILGWDFGYTCYLPQNVTLDNFVCNSEGTCTVFWNIDAEAQTDAVNPYRICKTVTFTNMAPMALSPRGSEPPFAGTVTKVQ